MARASNFVLVVILLFAGAFAGADPRWWTDDRAITTGPENKFHPDVAMPGYVMGARNPIVVVWEQKDAAGNKDVWLLLSMDRGCTWCPPKRWAGDPNRDETRPRVEFGINQLMKFLIHVVYERGDQVFVTADDTLDVQSPLICEELAALAPTTILLSPLAPLGEVDSRPRIARASRLNNRFSLFAVWQRLDTAGNPTVEFASNLLFGSVLGWTLTGRDLAAEIGGPGVTPDVAADTLGNPPETASAVTVFYTDPTSGTLKVSRNEQNGTPAAWTTTDLALSTSNPPLAPVADSSSADFMENAVWSGVVWQQAGPLDVWFDAARWTDTVTRDPDFDFVSDEPVGDPAEAALEPALAIGAPGGDQPAPLFAFWPRSRAPVVPEIFMRAGVLSAVAPAPPRDLDAYPFAPQRTAPPDPVASTVSPFSLCLWDEATGDCIPQIRPPASAGGAREVSAADGGVPNYFASVFVDGRTGEPQVYLKMNDDRVEIPSLTSVTPSCQALATARAEVAFDLLGECPSTGRMEPEWIDRYLVYYDPVGPAGPFTNRAVIDTWGPPPGSVTRTITDLAGDAVYTFVLIAEDEARNVNPPGFDPAGSANSPAMAQFQSVITPPCAPKLAVALCRSGATRCRMSDPWDDTRNPRPGETVLVTMPLTNGGDWEATDVTGTIKATNAAVLDPPAGELSLVSIPPIPPGSTVEVPVLLLIDPAVVCPATVELTVDTMASNGGAVSHGSASCGNPVLTVDDCTIRCEPCFARDLMSLGNSLTAVKTDAPPGGIAFGWSVAGDGAPEHHVNWVGGKIDIANARRPATGSGTEACGASDPLPTCTDDDALTSGGLLLFYQALSACGPTGPEEGPP